MPAKRAELLRLLESLGIPIGNAFRETVLKITSRAQISALVTALKANDVNAALSAAGMRVGSWSTLTEEVRSAYIKAGAFTVAADVPKRFGFEFDISNPRAENWISEYSSQLITAISNEQRKAIQVLLRAGMEAGRNPRSVALDLVGRISSQTGRRVGGIIGLSGQQTIAVTAARTDLENLSSKYFTRARRDRRFDPIVRKAIDSGKPLSKATVNKLTGRYSDRLLLLRGETIGRTEALRTLNASADEALQQVLDGGLAPPESAKRIWRHSFSKNERPGHVQMSGNERGMNESFVNPLTGAVLLRPGEGPASEVINCRCLIEHKIDFVKVEKAGGRPPTTSPQKKKPVKKVVKPKPKPKPKPTVAKMLSQQEAMKFYKADVAKGQSGFNKATSAFVRQGENPDNNMSLFLRGRGNLDSPELEKHFNKIADNWDGALTTKTTDDMTVFRGFSTDNLEQLKVGKTITDEGFWSTSLDRRVAQDFAEQEVKTVSVFLEIQTKAGTRFYNPLKNLSPGDAAVAIAKNEFELVLRPGTKIQILKIIERRGKIRRFGGESDIVMRIIARLIGEP